MTTNAIRLIHNDDPDDAMVATVGKGIRAYNIQQAGENNRQRLCFFLLGPDDRVVGGLVGATYWNYFYLELLWVEEAVRGLGHGRRLVEQAEEKARNRGAQYAYLDTFSFQAPGFYEKLGYEVFGELPEFPPGQRRYFYFKAL
jgi:ribosomal protein S18 acetylase RimI-like enzyme